MSFFFFPPKKADNEREYMEGIRLYVCVWRDLLRDNKEWEWEGKTEKIDSGTIRNSVLEAVKTQIESERERL